MTHEEAKNLLLRMVQDMPWAQEKTENDLMSEVVGTGLQLNIIERTRVDEHNSPITVTHCYISIWQDGELVSTPNSASQWNATKRLIAAFSPLRIQEVTQ
jgi:hypothetical protein